LWFKKIKKVYKPPHTHPDGAHVLFLCRPGLAAQPVVDPLDQVPNALGRGNDVEGRRHRASLLEVADPQFAPRVLPLRVRPFLHRTQNIREICTSEAIISFLLHFQLEDVVLEHEIELNAVDFSQYIFVL